MKEVVQIAIPEDLKFADLGLERVPSGDVAFNESAIVRICETSRIDSAVFLASNEINVGGLIVEWYSLARARGEPADPVAESLILECAIEEHAGQRIYLQPGRA
jgi:hypothetical protein